MDLSRFNKAQRSAIETTEGTLLILAGPGTGKTSVLIGKIQHLIEKGISPDSILAVTFSKKSTFEMQERLDRAQPGLSDRVNVCTLHAFCGDIVQRHGFRLGLQKRVRLLTETDAKFFFRQMAARLPLQPFLKTSNFTPVIDDLMKFFQNLKDEGYWPEDILRYASSLNEETEDEQKIKAEWVALGDLFNAQQSFCFEKGYIDFGDSIVAATRILKDSPVVREELHTRYRVILVDEFQDTNFVQTQLLRYVTSPQAHIAVVGDDDQSIYQFRGASSSAFRFFEQAFQHTKVVELNQTYRLPPEIVDLSTELIRQNSDRYRPDKILNSSQKYKTPVTLIKSSAYEDEALAICDRIEELLKSGVPPREIAVLARSRRHTELIQMEARRRKIPLEHSGSKDSFESEITGDLLAYLKVIGDPKDSVSFLRLLDSQILRMSADSIFSFCRWANRKDPFIDQLAEVEKSPLAPEIKTSLSNFFKIYKEAFAAASRRSASQTLFQLFEATGLIQFLLAHDKTSLKSLAKFYEQLTQWEELQSDRSLRNTLPVLELMGDRGDALESSEEIEIDRESIPILTVHASKGLEFDHVFVVSLVNQRFPARYQTPTWKIPAALQREESGTKEMQRQEERRLFYVAMTRAKKELVLTTVEKPYTKPSVFLTDDLKNLLGSQSLKVIERPKNESQYSFFEKHSRPFERRAALADPKPNLEPLSLSFSQLDKYETCPLAYEFQYEYRIPVSEPPQMAVGSVVHSSLERFARAVQNHQKPDRESLLKYFDEEFLEATKRSPELSEQHRLHAREKLEKYFDAQPDLLIAPLSVEQKFKLKIGEHILSGKIDRVDLVSDGPDAKVVRIVDYKTGKGKSSDDADDRRFADKSLQFSIYYLAATEILNWKVQELVFSYVYENTSLSTTRTPDENIKTKERILEIAQSIQNRRFDATPGRHCQWCEYRQICPSAKA